ncbi:MAG TPA: laccase domain-containing protein, partial [Acetobacteraceae bacterium]|nr:laccase domain-containing protein [Acetobacteraceae bacterium]
ALTLRGPASVVSTACSSGAKAFGEAAELVAAGLCDAALVGGVDSLCAMTLHGFGALELLAPGPCRPFAADRDGISIGEAAAFALLERPAEGPGGRVSLLGYGASVDAHHMSHPHPEAQGAVLAIREALASSGLAPADIDYVNFHGTGTKANDAAEDLAVARTVGRGPACSATKGWTGHALGASGALEAVIAAMCALGAARERIAAAIGPCIGQASYEVGADLREAVLARHAADARFFAPGRRDGRWQFDLAGYCAACLAAAGIRRVASVGADTAADAARFFSHRRRTLSGGGAIGHQISVIALPA